MECVVPVGNDPRGRNLPVGRPVADIGHLLTPGCTTQSDRGCFIGVEDISCGWADQSVYCVPEFLPGRDAGDFAVGIDDAAESETD